MRVWDSAIPKALREGVSEGLDVRKWVSNRVADAKDFAFNKAMFAIELGLTKTGHLLAKKVRKNND